MYSYNSSITIPALLWYQLYECMIVNARRMREGYCSHPVCQCVCVSVTTLALTYDACATKLAYQCILRCTQKVLNWAFSLKSLLSRVPACFLFALPNGQAILKHWSCYVEFNDHYQQLSMFNDCIQRIRRPLPHATTITKGRQIFLQYTVYTLPLVSYPARVRDYAASWRVVHMLA